MFRQINSRGDGVIKCDIKPSHNDLGRCPILNNKGRYMMLKNLNLIMAVVPWALILWPFGWQIQLIGLAVQILGAVNLFFAYKVGRRN